MARKERKKAPTIESRLVRSASSKSQTFHKYETPKGITVNSKAEAVVAEHLDALGIDYAYEPERITYTVERYYVPDFVLPNKIVVEVKGWFLSEDRRKLKLVRQQNPHLDIRMVFQKGALDKKGQQSKVTNREWCIKNGFKHAEGTVPEAWLHE